MEVKYRISSLDEVTQLLDNSEPLAFDLETKGFYGEIKLSQFYQKGWKEVLIVKNPEVIQLSFILKDSWLVAHNTNYEVSTIQVQLGAIFNKPNRLWLPSKWEDTLLLAKLQYWQKEEFSLDKCYSYMLGYDIYEAHDIDKKAMQTSDFTNPSHKQLQYAAIDVFWLLDLYEACSEYFDSQSYMLDKSASYNAFKFQTSGLPISLTRINQLKTKSLARIAEIGCPINVNSWQQTRKYIGESTSDQLALATFALEGNEKAGQVNEARKLLKQISFLDKFVAEAINSRIYGHFTFTTKSGRGNCANQNLQQLPRSTKGVFEAEQGNVLVMSDFAQLELRYICAISGDALMTKMFKEGLDMHTFTAEMMNVPRQQAKTCNFNLGYGGSAKMLRSIFIKEANMLLRLSVVENLKKKWHNLWKELSAWQDKATRDWKAKRPFETLLGRKMYAKLYTDAMNLPIQGGSADIAKLAMHKMFKAVEADEYLSKHVKFVNFIHDSFMYECPNDETIYIPLAKIIVNSMKEAWEELVQFTKVPDLPMPVNAVVGKNWGDLEYEVETPIYSITI